MKKFLLLFILFFSSLSFAGGGEGSSADDGGQAVVCEFYDAHRVSLSLRYYTVETLDLFEARRTFKGLPFAKLDDEFDGLGYWQLTDSASEILEKTKLQIGLLIGKTHPLLQMFDRAKMGKFRSSSDLLNATNDYDRLTVAMPINCKIVQLARKAPNGNITIDVGYAESLMQIDIAALFLHEALHDYFKDNGSNLVVRETVAYVLASDQFQKQNLNLFLEIVNTKRAVDPHRFK